MPAEVTHIIFADHFLKKYPKFERADFLVGTLFPDIRYLGVIAREETHPEVTNIDQVLGAYNSFDAGWKFHSYLDYILNDPYYQAFQRNDNKVRAAKFYQDMIVYREVEDWESIIACLRPKEDLPLGVIAEDRDRWYGLLREYFKANPTIESMQKFFNATAFPKDAQRDVMEQIKIFQNDPNVDRVLTDMTQKVHEAEIF
jgi:hypothetical protein